MPYPLRTPTTINCLPMDLITYESEQIFLKVIAVKEPDATNVTFFGLARIDNQQIENITMPIYGESYLLTLPIGNNETNFHFFRIPTSDYLNDLPFALRKYCSPLVNFMWHRLDIPDIHPTFVLKLIKDFPNAQSVTFNFPILDTLENLMGFEEFCIDQHRCELIPCSILRYILCPVTTFEPNGVTNVTHRHCTHPNCPGYRLKICNED